MWFVFVPKPPRGKKKKQDIGILGISVTSVTQQVTQRMRHLGIYGRVGAAFKNQGVLEDKFQVQRGGWTQTCTSMYEVHFFIFYILQFTCKLSFFFPVVGLSGWLFSNC